MELTPKQENIILGTLDYGCSKYPKHFRYLPAKFECFGTESSFLKKSKEYIFKDNALLRPIESVLGNTKTTKPRAKKIKWGEFYVLYAIGTTLYKIGHSTNFLRRYRDLCAASPLPLAVIKYCRCDNPNLLEEYLHEIFKDKYFKNEWFSLDHDDVCFIENELSKYFE